MLLAYVFDPDPLENMTGRPTSDRQTNQQTAMKVHREVTYPIIVIANQLDRKLTMSSKSTSTFWIERGEGEDQHGEKNLLHFYAFYCIPDQIR